MARGTCIVSSSVSLDTYNKIERLVSPECLDINISQFIRAILDMAVQMDQRAIKCALTVPALIAQAINEIYMKGDNNG